MIWFDSNFYFKFIYWFFFKYLNNCVSFKTPVVERWLIQMKWSVAAPALLVLSRVLFLIESTTAQIEMARKVASYIGMTVFQQQDIFLGRYF